MAFVKVFLVRIQDKLLHHSNPLENPSRWVIPPRRGDPFFSEMKMESYPGSIFVIQFISISMHLNEALIERAFTTTKSAAVLVKKEWKPDIIYTCSLHYKTIMIARVLQYLFKLGDKVKRSDVIAYSGSVGFASGPHLHFACFLGGFDRWRTLETKFRIGNGDQVEMLKEGIEYSRNY